GPSNRSAFTLCCAMAGRVSRSSLTLPPEIAVSSLARQQFLIRQRLYIDLRRGWLSGELLKCVVDKRADIPAVDKLIGSFAGRVMPARQHLRDEVHTKPGKTAQHFLRIFAQEGQIVGGMDDENLFRQSSKALHVVNRAD